MVSYLDGERDTKVETCMRAIEAGIAAAQSVDDDLIIPVRTGRAQLRPFLRLCVRGFLGVDAR